jgi:acetyltransferase-like isoleucine patch superfamily enzyme
MTSTLTKIRTNIRRPLPLLIAYLAAKLRGFVWRRYLGSAGHDLHLGAGTRIMGASRVAIGDRFVAGPLLWIEAVEEYNGFKYLPRITVGRNVTCSDMVHIAATGEVLIGDGVLMGSKVHITDHSHGVYSFLDQDPPSTPPSRRRLSTGRVEIQGNVWLADHVVVLPGVTIGFGTIVGANSVVADDLPAGVIAVGTPAMPIKRYNETTASWERIVGSRAATPTASSAPCRV